MKNLQILLLFLGLATSINFLAMEIEEEITTTKEDESSFPETEDIDTDIEETDLA